MRIDKTVTRPEFYAILNPRVIDGDAIEATIQLPFGACVIKRIRLKGFWAPEMKGRTPDLAVKATNQLEDWILTRDLFIRCPSERYDKYGRVIAELWSSEGPADPKAILGACQLSREAHKEDLDFSRAKKAEEPGELLPEVPYRQQQQEDEDVIVDLW
jgi:hypothetical protein